jgi:hypothetical protein
VLWGELGDGAVQVRGDTFHRDQVERCAVGSAALQVSRGLAGADRERHGECDGHGQVHHDGRVAGDDLLPAIISYPMPAWPGVGVADVMPAVW